MLTLQNNVIILFSYYLQAEVTYYLLIIIIKKINVFQIRIRFINYNIRQYIADKRGSKIPKISTDGGSFDKITWVNSSNNKMVSYIR